MIFNICCIALIILCWVVICFQRKDITTLEEVVSKLIDHDNKNLDLWNRQIGINNSLANFMSDVISVDEQGESNPVTTTSDKYDFETGI